MSTQDVSHRTPAPSEPSVYCEACKGAGALPDGARCAECFGTGISQEWVACSLTQREQSAWDQAYLDATDQGCSHVAAVERADRARRAARAQRADTG